MKDPIIWAFLISGGLAAGLAETGDPAPRPNIVFILSDDQARTDYGFMGHPEIKTPNLDNGVT